MGGAKECIGDYYTNCKCERSTKRKGEPATVSGKCSICKVLTHRCKAHCKCQKKAVGRNASRTSAPTQPSRPAEQVESMQPPGVAQAAVGAAAQPTIPVAVGRPLQLSLGVYTDASWVEQAKSDMELASNITMATLVMDSPGIRAALQRALERKADVKLILDREHHERKTCFGQVTCVNSLKRLGAEIFLCYGRPGRPGLGAMHTKCIVIDAKVAYWGSANVTSNAETHSWELFTRATGPQVTQMLEYICSLETKKGTIPLP